MKQDPYANAVEATIAILPFPDKWPRWPVLPLKNRKKFDLGPFENLGYMVVEGYEEEVKPPFKIRQGNIYAVSDKDPIIGEYKSVDDLLAAGWIID